MVILKKATASSLTEVLTASVIILIVFGIAIVTLDRTLQNSINKNTQGIETDLNELKYLYNHKKITLPYKNEKNNWLITIEKETNKKQVFILFEATHKFSKRKVIKKDYSVEIN